MSESFTCEDVPLLAKDTCRNWFYKISCIRELLPRVYVEIALLRCYRFLAHRELLPAILARIASLIRGLGDCVVAAYARVYLAVTAEEVWAWCRVRRRSLSLSHTHTHTVTGTHTVTDSVSVVVAGLSVSLSAGGLALLSLHAARP